MPGNPASARELIASVTESVESRQAAEWAFYVDTLQLLEEHRADLARIATNATGYLVETVRLEAMLRASIISGTTLAPDALRSAISAWSAAGRAVTG